MQIPYFYDPPDISAAELGKTAFYEVELHVGTRYISIHSRSINDSRKR